MKDLFLLVLFFATSVLFAQTKMNEVVSFSNKSDIVNFQFPKKDNYSVDYQKYLNFPMPFSIYNPKPGFNPTKMERQKYYSFENTNLLLKREMSAIEPEPIYPNQNEKKTIRDAVFEGIIDGIFSKK